MPLLTYTLTFNFNRSIRWTDDGQVPELMKVCVIPLANPSFPDQGTYVGGLQEQSVLLTDETNAISFSLVPTFAVGLSQPVHYRAEWRAGGQTGRIYSAEFAMPSQNVTYDQLVDLGDIITGVDYIQQSQIGVAGGIAALNSQGEVVDSTGTPVADSSDITTMTGLIDVEVTNRQNAINALQNTFSTSLAEDISGLATTVATNLADAIATLNANATSNFDELNNAITSEASTRTSADSTFTSEITSINSSITTINTALTHTATLTGGYLTSSQIPPQLILAAYPVSGQSGMLNLSTSTNNGSLPPVHYSDIAVWANGAVWMLAGDPANPQPSNINNWIDLTSVYSVNGLTGAVTITPAIIGAVGNAGSSGTVTQAQVTGLSSTLATYTPLTSFNTLNTTVSGILSNTNIVYLDTSGPSAGYINHTHNDANMAYVNNLNEVTLKDGTIIASGTGTVLTVNGDSGPNVVLNAADVGAVAIGGTIPESAVTGLLADLSARVLSSDSRLTNARTPTAHAASHELSGSDVLALDPSQITGLSTTLSALAPLSTVNSQGSQIAALQSSVTFLLGGGTPTSSPIKANWYDGTSTFSGVTNLPDFQNIYNVQLKGPFGKAISDGTYYYNPAGASANEWQYAYITPMGHLQLRSWNESNGADVVYATQAALNTTNATMATLATAASLNALQSQVNASATQASVNAITAWLPTGSPTTLATQTSVNALATQVGNSASQAALNATNATVATLATQSSVNTLSTAITGLASQTALNALSVTVSANANTLNTKADLSGPGNTVPLNELPNFPESQITNLVSDLAARATLVSGKVPIGQLPNIPESQVINLTTDLSNKADLVGGLVPSNQLPSFSINNVFTEPNEAGMLALSSAVVGDVCIISGSSAQGSYILAHTPPSTFSNWVLLQNPQAPVTSVNGQTGAVNLGSADVGAMAVGVAVPISQVTNLQSTLNGLATTASLNTAVNGLQSLAQVQGTLTASTEIKQAVNYVATSAISSLAGQQSIDGVLTPTGSVVLATAQPSSVNNGLWVVQSGAWTRTTDFATGAYFIRGTLAFVQNGTTRANTIWQETANSGIVDTNANNWSQVMVAGGPISYTAGNGISLASNTFSLNVVSGGGLSVTSNGATIDTGVVPRKFSGFVPAGSTISTISHGLNTTDIGAVFIREVASGNQVLAGTTVTGPNTLTIEFAAAPSTNQWRVTVLA